MIEYFTLQILKVPQSKLPLTDLDVNQQVHLVTACIVNSTGSLDFL